MSLEPSVICPVLIGRENDLLLLDRLMERSRAGRGQVALISGEAGIGKSRLVREVRARLPRGTRVLEGHCFQTEAVLPYGPVLDLFRSFFNGHPREEVARVMQAPAHHLQKLFPELAVLLPDLPAPGGPGPGPEQEKRLIFQALIQALAELAAGGPLVVILEDLHWSDSTSLDFLLLLARRTASQPVLLLLTYRSEETTPELTHFLAELDRERLGTEIALRPMSPPQVAGMLGAILDSGAPVGQAFLEAVFRLTEGNPFFVEETLKALIAQGDVFYAGGAWDQKEIGQLHIPRTIQDAVQRRTRHLDGRTLQALRLASVMGRRFDFRLLQNVLGLQEDDLTRMLKELIRAGLVVEETADRFAFRHTLTRQAVYSTLLLRERQGLHRTVAEALERSRAGSPEAHAGDLSLHYYTGGAWQKALEYSRLAGEQARSLYAQREAVVYYSRALVSARQLGIAPLPDILIDRGQAYEVLGDFSSALDDLEQALRLARQQNDGGAEWRTLIRLGILWQGRDFQRAGDFYRQAEELARALDEPKLRARSLNHIGSWHFMTGQTGQGLACHRQALEFFERERDEQGMAETRDLLGMATLHHGDQVGSFEEYRHAIRLLRRSGGKHNLVSALVGASHASYDETDHLPDQPVAENEAMAREALELARQIGWASEEAFAEWSLSIGLANRGRFGESLDHARACFRIAAEIEHRQRTASACYALGHCYLLMLQAGPAVRNLEAGLRLAQELGSAWLTGNITTDLAQAYLLRGDPRRARSLLDAALPPGEEEAGHLTRSKRRMLWARGQLLLAEKDPAGALQIAGRLLEAQGSGPGAAPIPGLSMLEGQALVALGRRQEAIQALEAASQGAGPRQLRPLLWQIHGLLGRLYKAKKDPEMSERHFTRAHQVVQDLAATIQEEELRAGFLHLAMRSLPGERKPGRREGEAGTFGGLTSREREVARLLSQGKSNREIAGALVLSERTVENHVASILRKLGFESRAQVAVWVVEKGLRGEN